MHANPDTFENPLWVHAFQGVMLCVGIAGETEERKVEGRGREREREGDAGRGRGIFFVVCHICQSTENSGSKSKYSIAA
jgi:hypothetical protein